VDGQYAQTNTEVSGRRDSPLDDSHYNNDGKTTATTKPNRT